MGERNNVMKKQTETKNLVFKKKSNSSDELQDTLRVLSDQYTKMDK
jgi:hypothetical protein